MAYNGSGVYSLPAGSTIANGETSDATDLNTPLQDLETAQNTARPVVAGGTGATSASAARTNLGVPALSAMGLQHLSTATISSDATVEFSSSIIDNSTYKDFMFVLRHVEPATDGASLYMRISTDGGSTFESGASSYAYVAISGTTAGGGPTETNAVASHVLVFSAAGTDTGEDGVSGSVTLFNAASSLRTIVKGEVSGRNNTGALAQRAFTGECGTTVVNGVQFLFSTGNLASGAISVYGVRG